MANSGSGVELSGLSELLAASLDPRQNKQAEMKIRAEEKKAGFSLALLQITASANLPATTRLAGALFFKNFIKRNWTDVQGNHKLSAQETATIKSELIGLMVSVPSSIQTQLGEAISVIAESDFWVQWDSLIADLVSRFTPDDHVVNAGVLQVAHSIFFRWRSLFRSDDLFTEINHVLGTFAGPYLQLLQNLDACIERDSSNKTALQQEFAELEVAIQIFYDLSSQDLPPQFEDALGPLSGLLLKYLRYDNKLLQTNDDDEAGPLENVKAAIFEGLTLYVEKYYDAFGPHVKQFVENSWALLTTIGTEQKYDSLVSKALNFLTSTASNPEEAQPFNNKEVLGQVVEKVILPNMSLRDSDIEMFEDEPIEFIRRDLEGSDSETRRRAATDFLRKLIEQFELPVTTVVSDYIQQYLTLYAANPQANWRSKDTAIYLFSSMAAKGISTVAMGVTQTNSLVDVGDFFSNNLANDLTGSDVPPILKVDAIKFLYTFRSIITKAQWQQVMSPLVSRMGEADYVVYTYAAVAVERVLYLVDDQGKPVIDPSDIIPLSQDLLAHLFSLIEKYPAPEKVQENEFLMRCVMRVLIVIKEGVRDVADMVLQHLVKITNIIYTNPSNPKFYYYHFESIGALIRFGGAAETAKLQETLFTTLMAVIENEVEEFMPYIFQLFAAILETDPKAPLPPAYQRLVQPIIAPTLWEQKGNVPALVRLLTAIIPRAAEDLIKSGQLNGVLGIFQKLASAKAFEIYSFDLLECVIQTYPAASLEHYWIDILTIMLTRLQKQEHVAFQMHFVRFYYFVASRDDKGLGTDFFVAATDKVQPDVFRGLYLSIILPKTQQISRPIDRRTAAVALTKTLSDSEAFITRYPKGWPHTCNTLLKLLEVPPAPAKGDDLITDHDVDDNSFGVGFTPLQTIKKPAVDPWTEVSDLRKWVGQYLQNADKRHAGRIGNVVQQNLTAESQAVLASYMRL